MTSRRSILLAGALLLSGCSGFLDGLGGGGGDDDDDGANDRSIFFYYGPMKLMYAESILYSVEAITGHDFGSWDFSAPDPGTQAFGGAGNGGAYYPHCRLLGGCMEHRIPLGRTSFVGTAYVLQLEKAIAEACYDRSALGMFPGDQAPAAATEPIDIIRHQYRKAFAEEARPTDLANSLTYFEAHMADPEFTDVSPLESAGRGHCRVLLTTNVFLFY